MKAQHLMIDDTRLKGRYSVLDIATLAAGCRGIDAWSRIEEAIQLLSAAEWHSLTPKDVKERQIIRESAMSRGQIFGRDEVDSRQHVLRSARENLERQRSLVADAQRDEKSGKIKRTALVRAICRSVSRTVSDEHANRLFNQWLKSRLEETREMYPDSELISLEELRLRYEGASKEKLLHDDDCASFIVRGMTDWLSRQNSQGQAAKPPRSRKGVKQGQFVSPKTRGAKRAKNGNFKDGE